MPGRRRGRPGLLGTVGRTAVIAGTAQATANAVNGRSRQQAMAAQPPVQQQPVQQVPAPPPAPPPAPLPSAAGETDIVASLSRLAHLRDSGALTEPEFQAAKARILA